MLLEFYIYGDVLHRFHLDALCRVCTQNGAVGVVARRVWTMQSLDHAVFSHHWLLCCSPELRSCYFSSLPQGGTASGQVSRGLPCVPPDRYIQ